MAQTTKHIFDEETIKITLMEQSIQITNTTKGNEPNITNISGWMSGMDERDLKLSEVRAKKRLEEMFPDRRFNIFLSTNTGTVKDRCW